MAVYLGSHNVDMLGGQTSGGGTANLQTKSKSYTPSTSQQTDTITPDTGYDGMDEVDITISAVATGTAGTPTASKGTVSNHAISVTPSVTNTTGYITGGTKTGTAVSVSASEVVSGTLSITSSGTKDVTNYASASVSAGTEGTPTASKGSVSNHAISVTPSVTNSAGYISGSTKTGTAVSVSASELVSGSQTITSNGTVDVTNLASVTVNVSGGGSSGMAVSTATKTLTSAASSISFTGLSGEPTSFVVTSSTTQTTGGTKVVAVVYDGSTLNGMDITTQAANDTGFTKSYSSGTLTITATSASFQANEYKLVYSYGGSSANIGTADVQVGSGATSITFTGLSDEPSYFSCIFKSTFSTSSGYQRVMEVVYDGTSTYGHALDSSANALTSWSYTYNNGTLVISSTGTNNGGYFHQPGYYQLTYGIGGEAPDITVESLSVTENGTYTAPSGKAYSPVTVNVSSGGSSMNVQTNQSTSRTNSTSLTSLISLTCSTAGTYDVYWTCTRSSTSGTWGSRLYLGGTAYGNSNQSTFSNHVQTVKLTDVSISKNQTVAVYGLSRGSNYYIYAPQLTIVQTA